MGIATVFGNLLYSLVFIIPLIGYVIFGIIAAPFWLIWKGCSKLKKIFKKPAPEE